jgi:hypothetical protein
MTKYCARCKQDKTTDNFYKMSNVKSGLQSYCKQCQNELDKITRAKRRLSGPTVIREDKVCQICNSRKPISQFGIRRDSADGHLSYCKPCWTEYVKKAKIKNK